MAELLPAFGHCDSLAVKYLIDELANKIQLQEPENALRGHIDAEFLSAIHAAPFERHLQSFRTACENCGGADSRSDIASIDT